MQVQDVMTNGCQTCAKDDTIRDAAKVMASENIGILPIAENNRLVGILTDRDIVARTLASGKDVDEAKADGCMTDEVLYCFNDQDTDEVAQNMGDRQIRRMPVVNRNKELVGMVSLGDLSSRGAGDAAGVALSDVSEPR